MSSRSSFSKCDTTIGFLEREKLAIWQTHPHWSEEQRQKAWNSRKRKIGLFLKNDAPPRLQPAIEQSSLLQLSSTGPQLGAVDIPGSRQDRQASDVTSAIPMSRSNTSKSSWLSTMSTPSNSQLQRFSEGSGSATNQQLANSYSASGNYLTADWKPSGRSTQDQQQSEVIFAPDEFFSTFENSSNNSQFATSQGVEGLHPSFLHSQSCNVSPSTSLSSDQSPYHFTTSEAMSRQMSRQSSMTSNSVVDAVGMMRVGSSFSACSDNTFPFPIDEDDEQEEEHQLDASFVSYSTEKPSSSTTITSAYLDENVLLSSVGHGSVGMHEHFFPDLCSSVGGMDGGCGCEQDVTMSSQYGAAMQRTESNDSNCSVSSAERKANERRQKHIENGKRVIVSKTLPAGPVSTNYAKLDSKARPLRPTEPGMKLKEAITKQPYTRPQHPKLVCELCDEYPEGFRGEHELRRHHDRAHAPRRKVWICVDPKTETPEGWRPARPLNICKQCMHQKQYNVYYNAAAHLRRAHFFPRKRGRRARGEERESRAGKAGGNFPPINWLKEHKFLIEIEVGPEEQPPIDVDEEDYEEASYPAFDPDIELQHKNLSAQQLGFGTYPIQTDFSYGYPTPDFNCDMQWSATCFPQLQQAPQMEYSMSAPPAVMTMNDHGSMYMGNNLSFQVETQF